MIREGINKYYCDCCDKEVSYEEYTNSTRVQIIIDLANPKGGCGERNGINMRLCYECAEKNGVVNNEQYHSYLNSRTRLKKVIEQNKNRLLKLFFNKQDKYTKIRNNLSSINWNEIDERDLDKLQEILKV